MPAPMPLSITSVTRLFTTTDTARLRGLVADRRSAHKLLMSCVETAALDKQRPRSDAQLQWAVDENHRGLLIRHRQGLAIAPPNGFDELPFDDGSSRIGRKSSPTDLAVTVARQYSPSVPRDREVERFLIERGLELPKRPRSRLVPVPAERLESWAHGLLERRGLTIHDLTVTASSDARLSAHRRRESVPTARIHAAVTGTPETIGELLDHGIGRARSYGLGLVLLTA